MKCIFCKKNSDSSKSVEHVIHESLGSKNVVLPKGMVCDSCNNYFSMKVEKPILSHTSFRNIRAWYQVANKKGKMPSVLGKIAGSDIKISMKLDKNKKLDIQPENESDRKLVEDEFSKMEKGNDFSSFIFTFEFAPPQREMSRFLAKMALEFFAYSFRENNDMIDAIINLENYDAIRDYAKKGDNFADWPYHSRRIYPIETKMVHPKTKELVMAGFGCDLLLNRRRETYFIFLYYGVEFAINLGGPSIMGYKEWLDENNQISPIIERNGKKIIKETIDNEDVYVIREAGGNESNQGFLFDVEQMDDFDFGNE